MAHTSFVAAFIIGSALGVSGLAPAQPVAPPTIHRVTLQPDSGVLTITGTGLGRDLLVSVDGQPVTVLPGASDTLVEAIAPATVLTLAGTYRLTVVDPARQVGDAFVVASQAAMVAAGSAALTGTSAVAPAIVTAPAGPPVAGSGLPADRRSSNGPAPLVIEEANFPYRTALGFQALGSNTSGTYNTASGHSALSSNTTGVLNTANGATALNTNSSGSENTAVGNFALLRNTSGSRNTASGTGALSSNTTASENTASGYYALGSNTTGYDNTASGYQALYNNTEGFQNTAAGAFALYFNTTGSFNLASGTRALAANTVGYYNAAHGVESLANNTTGFKNTASGLWALLSNTTGALNTGVGFNAGANVTTGSHNVYLGADVVGTSSDSNTMRLGLAYDSGTGTGQNRTFVAGIHGTQVPGSYLQVVVNANGQLGTLIPPVQLGGSATATPLSVLQQQVQEQQAMIAALQQRSRDEQATNADLRARLARLEALVSGRGGRQ